jgi:alpha-1,3-rhamnosyltransferase
MKDLLILDNASYTVMPPLVSIIVPCYNHEPYIVEALNSILDDTYLNKEIVIIDDGSKDHSKTIIEGWISTHKQLPITFISRENKGVCATLNEMVNISKGKYIVCLASDDKLFNNTIEERVNLLQNLESAGKLVLVSDAQVIDEHGQITSNSSMTNYNHGNKDRYHTDEGILYETIMNPSISGATVMINKSIFEKIGPYPEDLRAEDWFFYQRAASIHAIYFYDKVVSQYRVHTGSTSGAKAPLKTQKAIAHAMLLTYWRNLSFFSTFRFKMLGIRQLLKYYWTLTKINIKILVYDK